MVDQTKELHSDTMGCWTAQEVISSLVCSTQAFVNAYNKVCDRNRQGAKVGQVLKRHAFGEVELMEVTFNEDTCCIHVITATSFACL